MSSKFIHGSLKSISGDILSDTWQRYMYASDASAYEIVPKCIVLPRNIDDVIKVVQFASENNISVIARGGGSGLAGQAIGDGIIIDFTKYMNKIVEVNTNENYVVVEPGLYKGILDRNLVTNGTFLPPDPSSANYCTVGGMIATNASGAHTVKYGSTIDYVLSLDVILSNGELIHVESIVIGSDAWYNKDKSIEGTLLKSLLKLLKPNEELIRTKFPNVRKNSCGYRIDKVLGDNMLDMCKLFVASEGTLGIVVKAKFRILDLPKEKTLLLLGFDSTLRASQSIKKILELEPSAVELLDKTVIRLASTENNELSSMLQSDFNCLLFVEFDGTNTSEMKECVNNLSEIVHEIKGKIITFSSDDEEIARLWEIRKNVLSYTMKIREGERKPIAFMEDPVVSVDKLGFLVDTLQQVYGKYGLNYVIYGHAGDGNLHTRPLLDVGNTEDMKIMKDISKDLLNAITSVNGSISGEHGDGLARSEFIRDVYGDGIYQLFVKIKEMFDPNNIMNPNKKITLSGTFVKNFRYGYKRRYQENVLK